MAIQHHPPARISMADRLRTDLGWTPRQRQVLDLMVKGKSNTEIAETLGVSLAGAKWHVSEILSKLDAESREEAAEYWRRYNGLMPRFGRVFRGFLAVGAAKPLSAALALATGATVVAIGVGAVVALKEQSSNEASTSGSASATAAIEDNAARDDPFEGELASIRVQTAPVSSSGFEVCSQGLEPLPVAAAEARVTAPGALGIDPAKLPLSLRQTGSAEGWLCGDEIALASRIFQIHPGTAGVNPGGGSMTVVRSRGPAVVSMSAPRSYWQELSIGTQTVALFERPASEGGGPTCLAASLESGTQVFTQVMGTNSQGSVCLETLAAVLAQ